MVTVFKDYSKFNLNDLDKYKIAPYDIEHSIGGLYGGASKFVFGKDFNEGKLMGLAPYGKSGRFPEELFLIEDARVKINYDLIEDLGIKNTNIKDDFQYCADLAKWVQEQTEKALFYILNSYHKMYASDNLCYAGGLALNAVANGKIIKNTPFKNVYIQPAAGDNGLAIGACYYGWMKVLNKEKVLFNGNPYFGIKYDESKSSLRKYLNDNYAITKPDNLDEVVAKHISKGKVVGCFRNGSEFGPRALGNRSILADPRRKEMLDYINIEIKNREEFRPFAPSILKDRYLDFFRPGNEDSDYMIKVSQVIPEKSEQISAVVHVDGSARVQTVTRELNRDYYNLINEFYKLTGIPILLNTSFNGKDTPIVETPEDAINFYKESKLDFLIINNYLIYRK
ncbi:carbamoyltransferase [Xenorhabdus stockiae]|uniref:Carbamoyltransferase n=1 Tax=Xenorhabdus stockiae TaxID=351614 RepID=A0A2D0KLS0_9GAMM|nr:carbamoyltransferase C-terminal domain-containing protein [Xenorhabdus stockiae]PHM64012.1 carbamoyltransferase [Xenorhabdus stockiae]PHM64389.1 carbamoyltransferase [Xenorhabdus stockiae]